MLGIKISIVNLIERYIRRTKNPDFSFDKALETSVLLSLLTIKMVQFIRGLKFFHMKKRGVLIFLGSGVSVFNKKNIYLGNNVQIARNVSLNALGKQPLRIGSNVSIGSFSSVIISTSFNNIGEFIFIGDNVGIGEYAYIGGGGGTSIGEGTIIGQYLSIHPENHIYADLGKAIRLQGVTREGVSIGKNCWIGSKVTITDGVRLGENSVVAAGSVLTESFPKNVVVAGVPAKIIREIK